MLAGRRGFSRMADTPQNTAGGEPPVVPTLYARARRLAGYGLWNGAAFAVPLGLDRLVICPALNKHLGVDVFGAFIWVMGLINVFGIATSAGFGNYLMRDLAHRAEGQAQRLLRTVFVATVCVGACVLIISALVSYGIADDVVRRWAWALYVPLCVFGVVRCIQEISVAALRIQRRFSGIFGIKMVEALVLLAVLVVASSRQLWIIGGVYIASVLLSAVAGCYLIRAAIGWGSWWDWGAVRCLRIAWPGLALSALIDHSVVNSPRIVLGAMRDSAAVTELFAGTSMGNLFVAPIGIMGVVVLSLISSRSDFALAGRKGKAYLAICLGTAASVGLASFLLGRVLVTWRYPAVAASTLKFYHWIAVANACVSVTVLMRPVALKYARIRVIAALSVATLGLELLMLVILVPIAGAHGAAISLAISSGISMTMWLACFLTLRRKAGETPDAGNGAT